MGGVGFTEMLLLAVIALIFVGPERLPKIARTMGQLTRQARGAWQNLQSELQAEIDADHNRKIMQAKPAAEDPKPEPTAEPAAEAIPKETADAASEPDANTSTRDERDQPER